MSARKRYGVIKRSPSEARTFNGVIHDSKLECSRAMQLYYETATAWTHHPGTLSLGCPENTYKPDFQVWDDEHPEGRYEEIKGPVQTGVRRLKKLWKAYGPCPLVILMAAGRGTGLSQQWKRDVVLPTREKAK